MVMDEVNDASERSFGAVVYSARESGAPLYLLVLHAGGHWGLPKGHALPGESARSTVVREVREETGCEIELIAGYADSITYPLPAGGTKRVDYLLARLKAAGAVPLPSEEIRAVGWFTLEEARRTATHETTRRVLQRAHDHLHLRRTDRG